MVTLPHGVASSCALWDLNPQQTVLETVIRANRIQGALVQSLYASAAKVANRGETGSLFLLRCGRGGSQTRPQYRINCLTIIARLIDGLPRWDNGQFDLGLSWFRLSWLTGRRCSRRCLQSGLGRDQRWVAVAAAGALQAALTSIAKRAIQRTCFTVRRMAQRHYNGSEFQKVVRLDYCSAALSPAEP